MIIATDGSGLLAENTAGYSVIIEYDESPSTSNLDSEFSTKSRIAKKIYGRIAATEYDNVQLTINANNIICIEFTQGKTKIAPTNNRGELMGILIALYYVYATNIQEHVTILTDSMYSINCINKWYPSWKAKNNFYGKKNLDLLKIIDILVASLKNRGKYFELEHINSHIPMYKVEQIADVQLKRKHTLNAIADYYATLGRKSNKKVIIE